MCPGPQASADRFSAVMQRKMILANGRYDLGRSHCCGCGWLAGIGAALKWALNQGALTGAAVEAVNAWQVPQVPGGRISTMGVDLSAMSKEILRNAVEAIGASAESVTERAVQGHPVKVLVDASDGADLLVVGNRGHGGFTGMLPGRSADRSWLMLIAPQLSCVRSSIET